MKPQQGPASPCSPVRMSFCFRAAWLLLNTILSARGNSCQRPPPCLPVVWYPRPHLQLPPSLKELNAAGETINV